LRMLSDMAPTGNQHRGRGPPAPAIATCAGCPCARGPGAKCQRHDGRPASAVKGEANWQSEHEPPLAVVSPSPVCPAASGTAAPERLKPYLRPVLRCSPWAVAAQSKAHAGPKLRRSGPCLCLTPHAAHGIRMHCICMDNGTWSRFGFSLLLFASVVLCSAPQPRRKW
jgi:hypothetical protein